MKKKVLSLVLTAAMMTTMLAGCGSSDNGSQTASTGEAPAASTEAAQQLPPVRHPQQQPLRLQQLPPKQHLQKKLP